MPRENKKKPEEIQQLWEAILNNPVSTHGGEKNDLSSTLLHLVRKNLRGSARIHHDPHSVVNSLYKSLAGHLADSDGPLQPAGNLQQWLIAGAKRHANKRNKRDQRDRLRPFPVDREGRPIEPADEADDPVENLEPETVVGGIEVILEKFKEHLSERQVQVLDLRFIQGSPISAIAGELGKSIAAINRDISKIKSVAHEIFREMELTDE